MVLLRDLFLICYKYCPPTGRFFTARRRFRRPFAVRTQYTHHEMGYNPKPIHTSGVETEGVDGNGYEIALYLMFE
jgi:hypothetical protein